MVAFKGNQVKIMPSVGEPTEMKHVKHVKNIPPADRYIKQLPDYTAFGRRTTLRLNPDKVPNLHWNLANSYHTTNIGLAVSNTVETSPNYIDVNTSSYAKGNKCKEWCSVSLLTDVNVVQCNMRPIVSSTVGHTK